ncbi:DMT family transporter [Sphingomonas yantingensis]|jgi:drug/metabolite transporter (DMT)-like permease|uniref:Drug/metabolite transporter (DMT)-like permease n=2 Tax=Sphingomonas TaxID=13687 RepID=A0A7W9AN99_9SPHN|nr:DMT family transporter [Sphingomonas yantingensis]MBB5697578.1 drug/metabolite transporter (DMT)-like permease [Sphingomonas yantingensis]HCB76527.1 permease [Sphingomonas bacterium]
MDRPAPAFSPIRAYAMLGLVMLLWAGNSIVGRAIREDVAPLTLALMRWSGALAIVLPFAWRSLSRDRAVIAANWRILLLLGLLGIAAFNALLYSGLAATTASNALLLQAAVPAAVLVVDRLGFGIRARGIEVAAVVVGSLGVALIVFRADWATLIAFRLNPGDALILASVVVWALYTSLLRKRPAIAPASFLAVTFAIGVAAMLPAAATEWAQGHGIRPGPRAFAGVAYVAIFPSTIAYALYNRAVMAIGPASAGRTIALLPLFGALLAALLLGEPLYAYHAVGMAMILTGILLPLARRT